MLILGYNTHFQEEGHEQRQVNEVYLSDEARKQGTYIIGTTGTGKTTLLMNMIFQDMKHGDGLCVLDPHGDFTYDILSRVPKNRREDVILFDPADIDYPVGLNLFDCNKDDPKERDLVVSTTIDTLYKLFQDSWGPRMEDLLRHAILSLLHHPEPTTLVHLMMMLVNYEKRQELTKRAKEVDPILRFYWEDQFPESSKTKAGGYTRPRDQVELVSSSLNKIGRFIANPVIRHIV
ncbi:MAG: type IV secretion system DNA-binding domain-containing protein, partial [Chlamydiia bacterium]|nr:type IV secretion system DNA-binding domain-containing protein [Chlamydiia bacterium]